MSAQTGTPAFEQPPSSRAIDLARNRIARVKNEPNPIWIRELKQAARLQRTPFILMTIAGLVALLMSAIGGIGSIAGNPASTGVALFQTFFSVAFFVVMLVGPALAANSVASEREGRTWEAVILTGLSPKAVAWGKFLSAFTSVSMYIVMLAPVGALPFLFGGVTAWEVLIAFAFLFLFALLSVAFGLAISSKMASGRTAIVVTLLLAFPLSLAVYLGLGLGLSYVANDLWPAVSKGTPVWLPTAYERAPFSVEYVTFLFLMPVAAVAIPAWFFYEVTVANLTSWSDDRSTGLKRWFAIMTPVLVVTSAISAAVQASATTVTAGFLVAIFVTLVFLVFGLFIFLGEPLGPSRRVVVKWQRSGAGWVRRVFGPGLVKTSILALVLGCGALLVLAVTGFLLTIQLNASSPTRAYQLESIGVFLGYAVCWFVFLLGFGTWVRSKVSTSAIARVMLIVAVFVSAAGPWIIAAIAGVAMDDYSSNALVVAAPSPVFVLVLLDTLRGSNRVTNLVAGGVCSAAWAMIGSGLLLAGSMRCRQIVSRHYQALAEADAMLAKEDLQQEAKAGQSGEPQGQTAESQTQVGGAPA